MNNLNSVIIEGVTSSAVEKIQVPAFGLGVVFELTSSRKMVGSAGLEVFNISIRVKAFQQLAKSVYQRWSPNSNVKVVGAMFNDDAGLYLMAEYIEFKQKEEPRKL
jgi:hypothetical protein